MLFKKSLLSLIIILLVGCAGRPAYQPTISNISDSAVSVRIAGPIPPFKEAQQELMSMILNEAERGCATYGKVARGISHRCAEKEGIICYTYEFLFSCTEN